MFVARQWTIRISVPMSYISLWEIVPKVQGCLKSPFKHIVRPESVLVNCGTLHFLHIRCIACLGLLLDLVYCWSSVLIPSWFIAGLGLLSQYRASLFIAALPVKHCLRTSMLEDFVWQSTIESDAAYQSLHMLLLCYIIAIT